MEPFKRSRDPPPKGSDMDQDEDTAFADNYAERDQAKALREQARAGGLRFEAYLTGDQADWLLERIERGMFADPSEAVFAIVKNFIEMEPNHDLSDELLRRRLEGAIKQIGRAYVLRTSQEWKSRMPASRCKKKKQT